jgi:gluconolactonase
MNKKTILVLMVTSFLTSEIMAQKSIGKLVATSEKFYELVDKSAKIEVLAEGLNWSEGPVWDKEGKRVFFSDVPENTIYQWKEGEGLSVFLKPSGYTGKLPYSFEPGSNGLTINNDGELVASEHGDRRVTRMPINGRGGKYPIADNWQGKRFNSPNDVIQATNGTYYFTDPPYGLPGQDKSTSREIDAFGVYMVKPGGKAELIISDLTRPNGVALSPDEKTLYIAQSDPTAAYIMSYPVNADGTVGKGKVLYDAGPLMKQGLRGLPDGLKVDKNGNIFTTGPGGVLVLTPKGELLGRIDTGEATANCAWGEDGSTLFITADMYLCRIRTKTTGKGF